MKSKGHPPATKLEKEMVALMQRQDLKSLTAQKAPRHQPQGNVPMRGGVFRGKPSARGK